MNPGGLRDSRIEELRYARKVAVRIAAYDSRQSGQALRVGAEHHGRCSSAGELRAESGIREKGDLAGTCPLQRTDLLDQYFLLAGDAAAEPVRDLRERERPGHVILRRRAACLPSP